MPYDAKVQEEEAEDQEAEEVEVEEAGEEEALQPHLTPMFLNNLRNKPKT